MKREGKTNRFAGLIRAKDKMYEYLVHPAAHPPLQGGFEPTLTFPIAVGFLGDFASETVSTFLGSNPSTSTKVEDVEFSAKLFLSFANAQFDKTINAELRLLSGASFYLANMPGAAQVQARSLTSTSATMPFAERALLWLCSTPWKGRLEWDPENPYISSVCQAVSSHYRRGISKDYLRDCVGILRQHAYSNESDHGLLLADVVSAIAIQRHEHSTRNLLYRFSSTDPSVWQDYLSVDSSVHELWPSQRALGEAGVFSGASAVVQMPTSAGKTKATELILRTAFASDRANVAVIVAPFVALCDEIHGSLRSALSVTGVKVNQIGDALQNDYLAAFPELSGFNLLPPEKHVVVLTPEKLAYVLRQNPSLAASIDLLVYDEGHQFDSGPRGVTYELLLASIKTHLRRAVQTVLISAVIDNADDVADWLLGKPRQAGHHPQVSKWTPARPGFLLVQGRLPGTQGSGASRAKQKAWHAKPGSWRPALSALPARF